MRRSAIIVAPLLYLAAFLVAPGSAIIATEAAFVVGFLLILGLIAARQAA